MSVTSDEKVSDLAPKEQKKLRGELFVLVPGLIFALTLFAGSFQMEFDAGAVPMLIGLGTAILIGMRIFHVLFPKSKIGAFKEAGLGGDFDRLKDEIEEETLKGKYEEKPARKITFRTEIKAFGALIGSSLSFILFGYLVGIFFVIVGTSYYYGYRYKGHILISLVSMYIIVYVILYKMLEAPADYGLLLEPILRSLGLIY
jgi:hypothetical protein